MNPGTATLVIEAVTPQIDGGRHPIKRAEGEDVVVEADILKDGHDIISAVLKWRRAGDPAWNETPMTPLADDRWRGVLSVTAVGCYEYTIEAWGDGFLSWRDEVVKKVDGGLAALASEALEGARILRAAAARAFLVKEDALRAASAGDAATLEAFAAALEIAEPARLKEIATDPCLEGLMRFHADRSLATTYGPTLAIRVDRRAAAFAAWYEFFPRSAEGRADRGSTFRDCIGRIDDAREMGFDVIYFPPIHPIGETNRKGRNNAAACEPGEPGVPYAIGNFRQGVNGGGHKDVAPELGTLADFDWLVGETRARGMEVALDFAINCSPDHPYVSAHPDWFFQRPDGTIKYAENPPKKYEDVYPLNFHCADWRNLWAEMRDVLLFWAGHGVRTFRVDNPHTKPVAFWEWVIAEVQAQFPDAIFLSEAFTRPKMMRALAKAGFTQSYTYFTWRTGKDELIEYFEELAQGEMADYFRGNLFTNTPDILPEHLQTGGRPAFIVRAVLAATLSPIYGIYSGFELCEATPVREGREEYLDSEKYQFRSRDWNAPGNIKDVITALNRARRDQRALQEYRNLRFHPSDNPAVLFYSKMTAARDSIVLVAVNLDPHSFQSAWLAVPITDFGSNPAETYEVRDLLTGERFLWQGARNFVALDPRTRPAHVLEVRRLQSRELGVNIYA
ncbi:MAG: alpha-1,4-glucan--maltose-1-phosphate maltosyltransferase [Terrimicrobiaceae bacterium]|nr:alpha-1,4-glucan--maltose-1-phosphate maltosyltransferase [Terrimicrobiaceae bacterium]